MMNCGTNGQYYEIMPVGIYQCTMNGGNRQITLYQVHFLIFFSFALYRSAKQMKNLISWCVFFDSTNRKNI